MSLSKNIRKSTGKEESWHKYEMESLESYKLQKQGKKNEFVSLDTGEGEISKFVPLDAWENADSKKEEIENNLLGTQEKISGIEQEAYEKSFAQGEKDGFEFGEKKAIKIIENIENIFNEIASLKHDVLKQQEREIIDLIFAVAEKIVHHEVRSKESVIKNAILDALKLAVEKSKVVFNVNPDDYDYVEKLRPEIFNQNKGLKSIIVTSDPGVSRGGCYLETPYGNIDATIESKLEKIYQCLQESVE
ncbi:MAG: FliH/SctL family protein [Desulfobacteraceae bacterium]|nr:FliH/SctL family protein [Desulfobacteraceae bacterium]